MTKFPKLVEIYKTVQKKDIDLFATKFNALSKERIEKCAKASEQWGYFPDPPYFQHYQSEKVQSTSCLKIFIIHCVRCNFHGHNSYQCHHYLDNQPSNSFNQSQVNRSLSVRRCLKNKSMTTMGPGSNKVN